MIEISNRRDSSLAATAMILAENGIIRRRSLHCIELTDIGQLSSFMFFQIVQTGARICVVLTLNKPLNMTMRFVISESLT